MPRSQRFSIAWRCFALLIAAVALGPPVAAAQGKGGQTRGGNDAAPADDDDSSSQMMTNMGDEQDEEARQHFEAATRLYQLGSFSRAGEEFQLAYDLSHRAPLLYNVYLSYRDAQVMDKAAEALRAYIDASPDAPDRQNLEARLEALEKSVAEQKARQEQAAQASQQETTEPGPGPQPPPVAPPPKSRSVLLPAVLIGVGGAALIGAAVTGALAMSGQSDIDDKCNGSTKCPADYTGLEDDKSSVKTLATVTDVLWIGGAVVAGTGLALLLFGGGDEESESPTATAVCLPGACMANVTGRF